ncbi:MAG TPA: hypothetical protein VD993_07115 [Chitinophagaceae bacterium]|nr:hypothetical protein [Chitinophagaceae bacterium]
MKNVALAYIACISLLAASCAKDHNDGAEPINSTASKEFAPCNCSKTGKDGTDYIKGEFSGVFMCFDLDDNGVNQLRYGFIYRKTDTTYYDKIAISRRTPDEKFYLAMYLENPSIFSKKFPYQLPRPDPGYCEIGEVQLENVDKRTPNTCYTCSWSNWHYYNQFRSGGLTLYVDKFENNRIEGRFEGVMMTGTGKATTVKNGMFSIRLDVLNQDVHIP